MTAAIWGFLGTAIGAGASIIATLISRKHEQKLKNQEISYQDKLRMKLFQQETLLKLQETLKEAMGLAEQILHIHKEKLALGQNTFFMGEAYDELVEKSRLAGAELQVLCERVQDEHLREGIKELHKKMVEPEFSSTFEKAQNLLISITSDHALVQEKIGKALREQY
jgi:hypothetical protein